MAEHVIDIKRNISTFIYSDDLIPLTEVGPTETMRASHVEPHPTQRGWIADMHPSGGPILGAETAFPTREAALQAERDWLRQEKGL